MPNTVDRLTYDDCLFIIESLDWTVQKFENYQQYPSYEFKQRRVMEAKAIRQKVRDLRGAAKIRESANA